VAAVGQTLLGEVQDPAEQPPSLNPGSSSSGLWLRLWEFVL